MPKKPVENPDRSSLHGRFALTHPLVHAALIILLCLLAYSNTFQVPFQFDDPRSITEVSFVRDLREFPNVLTQPRSIGFLSFALNYRLHGTDVAGYHVVNLVIHIINALLLYQFVMLCFRTPVLKTSSLGVYAKPIALFSALLFAGHPVQTQAVTYIAQRFASLATLFFLLSIVAYTASRLATTGQRSRRKAIAWYVVSFCSAVLAMKTKEIAFTLPVVIALHELLFFEGPIKKRLLIVLPLVLTMVIIPMSLLGTAGPLGDVISDVSEVTRLQTDTTRSEYLFTQFTVIVTYLRLLALPMNQNLDYDYPLYQSFISWEVVPSFLLLMVIFGIGVYLVYRDRRSPGSGRLIAFAIFWFFITLAVESSIIPIADVIFEHRLYLPSIGFFLMCTVSLFLGVERLRSRWPCAGKTLTIVLTVVVLLFASLAHVRNRVWQSEERLWKDVIRKSPLKARGYNGLGLAYYNRREHDQAIEAFARAIALHPAYGVAYNNLGNALYWKGLVDQAVEVQSKAIALDPNNPAFHDNRGLSYAAKGDLDRAIADFERAIALDPSAASAHHNLGSVYHRLRQYGRAIEEYSRSISREPANAMVYSNRALSYAEQGDFKRALEDYGLAITLKPDLDAAYSGRGAVLGARGQIDQAIADFSQAISLNPSNANYYMNRGIAYSRADRRAEAITDFQQACMMGSQNGCALLKQLQKSLR